VRVLVTGGRDYDRTATVFRELDFLLRSHGEVTVIEGGARGADRIARQWCANCSGGHVECEDFNADWKRFGKAAGAIRNQEMLDSGVDLVLAFPGGRGTADMVKRAKSAGVRVIEVQQPERQS
jgi:hypothetical protein